VIRAAPYTKGASLPEKGIYLFSENGKHLYVGRSNNIKTRRGDHYSSNPSRAAFARLIACKELNLPPPTYLKGSGARLTTSKFKIAFGEARKRIKEMEFRAVEESDPTRQALLELYCAITLETPYNDFDVH